MVRIFLISLFVLTTERLGLGIGLLPKPASVESPPPRGDELVEIGEDLFVGGLGAIVIGLGLFSRSASNHGWGDGQTFELLGISAMVLSPFFYIPGYTREEKYQLWKEGRLSILKGFDGFSELNRARKSYGIHINLFGSEGGDGNSFGAIMSKFLHRNRLIELNVASSQEEDFGSANLESNLAHGYYALRQTVFMGNSFYWTAGAAYREFRGHLSRQTPGATHFYEIEQRDIGADGAIGNRWQWQSFSMGFDWVGIYIPIIKLLQHRRQGKTPPSINGGAADKAIENQDYRRNIGYQALRFHLGSTF